MPLCKNIPPGEKKCYYTGQEKTPRGKGYVAKYCDGETKKANNGEKYLAKNGRWVKKASSMKRQTSPSRNKIRRKSSPKRKTSPQMHMPSDYSAAKKSLFDQIVNIWREEDFLYDDDVLKDLSKLNESELERAKILSEGISRGTLVPLTGQKIVELSIWE